MESTIRIEINKTTKKFRLVDLTDYTLQGVALATLSAKGLGTLRFAGNIVAQKLTTIDPLVNLATGATASAWFDCVLDSDGAIAYGIYSISDYSVRTALVNESADAVTAGTGGAGGFTINSLNLSNVLADGDTITISSSLAGNNGAKTISSVSLVSGNSTLFVDQSINAEIVPSSNISFDITKVTGAASGTYAGCEEITLSVSFNADCERGLNGSIVVLDTTSYGDQEVTSKELTLMYPSWTDTANVTSTDGAITLSAIATGTYTITSETTLSLTNGDLVITYVASLSDEYRVSCSGSLCGLLPCIQNLLQVHAAAVKNGFSPYQYFVDSILLNYVQAVEYKKCGEFDKYQERVDAIESLLDASGCECSCCDNDALYWVINIDPEENNILTQIQADILALQEEIDAQDEIITELAGITTQLESDLSVVEANLQVITDSFPFAYLATASQSGTSAPALTIGVNQTGLTLTAGYTGVGNYTLTSAVPFDPTKVVVAQVATTNIFKRVTAYVESSTVIRIQTFDNVSGVAENNILLDSKIHIQVYP